jgi:hypothetical protein
MTAGPRTIALRVAFVLLLAISVWGFFSHGLLNQRIWNPIGQERLVWLSVLYTAWFGGISLLRPRLFALLTLLGMLAYTVAAVGPLAPLATIFFLFSSLVLGSLLLGGPGEDSLAGLLALLLGVSAYVLLVSVAVHFPVNYVAVYFAAFAIPIVAKPGLAAALARRSLALVRPWAPAGRGGHIMLGLASFVFVTHWLVALKPETGGDALAMHLAIPASVAAHHSWVFDFRHTVWAVMPMGADWSFTAVFLLGGEHAARLLNFAMLVLVAGMLYLAIRRWLPAAPALLVIALLASSPVAQLVTGSLMAENFWAALLLAAGLALCRHYELGEPRWFYVAAVLTGVAVSTKFGSLAFLAPAALFCTPGFYRRARAGKTGTLRVLLLGFTCFLLFASQPYLTAWWKTGNPVFPFLNTVFRSPHFDATVLFTDYRFRAWFGWRTLYDMTFLTSKFMEGQNGAWGFHYLLLTPLGLLAVRRDWPALGHLAALVTLLFPALTFLAQSNLRYLFPALPYLMIVAALLLVRLRSADPPLYTAAFAASLAALLLNIYFLASSAWYHKDFYLNIPFDRAGVERYVQDSAPVRKLVDHLNREHPGEPAAFFESNQIAGLRGRAYTSSWHNEAFARRLRFAASATQCLELMNELGIRNFIAPSKEGRLPLTQSSIRSFLDEYTEPQLSVGRYYFSRLKGEFAGAAGQRNADLLATGLLPSGPGTYDDFNPRLRFSEGWTRDQQFAQTSGSTLTYSNAPGAAVRFLFRGTRLTWLHTKAPNRGLAELTIDGASRRVVDLYAPAASWRSAAVLDLAPGEHELVVRVLHSKSPASEGFFIDVDALIVE